MPISGSFMNEIIFYCKENGDPVNEKIPLTIDVHGITSFDENLFKIGELELNLSQFFNKKEFSVELYLEKSEFRLSKISFTLNICVEDVLFAILS
jgi:hypothetical protein